VCAQNPHLPAAAPADLLSREMTGEVKSRRLTPQKVLTGAKPRVFFSLHWVQGSVLPKEARNPPRVSHTIEFLPFRSVGCLLIGARYGSIACSGSILNATILNDLAGRKRPDLLTDLAGRNSKLSETGPAQ
jgi:hypothetical protein